MVKNIHLKLDKAFFFKMKSDKLARELKLSKDLTWEEYIEILFGFRK